MSSWSRHRIAVAAVPSLPPPTSVALTAAQPPPKKLKHVHYAPPTCNDTALILVFFNPSGSFRIQQNLLYVKHQLEVASIPFFIGELVYNDSAPFLDSEKDKRVFTYRTSSYMFSKENIINCVLENTNIKAYTKYIIMDCDVVFEIPDWIDTISNTLDSYDVIQPFQFVHQLDISFKSSAVKQSIIADPIHGHTGYVWAFRKDWIESMGGLYMYALIGGGDKCLAYMAGVHGVSIPKPYIEDIPNKNTTTRCTFLPYTIWHLPHGNLKNRKYIERADLLLQTMIRLGIHKLHNAVNVNTQGIFEWKPEFKIDLNTLMLNYFNSREDDGYF